MGIEALAGLTEALKAMLLYAVPVTGPPMLTLPGGVGPETHAANAALMFLLTWETATRTTVAVAREDLLS